MKNYFHPHYFQVLGNRIKIKFWNLFNRINAAWWQINMGANCSFMGKTTFRKLPFSQITIGKNCHFNSTHTSNTIGVYCPCIVSTISPHAKIEIGDKCGFSGTVIGAALHIKLGNNVRCGANTLITDSDWHTDDPRTGEDKAVIIEDNVWLGYGVKVLKGVHIGKNSLIGAGSIVTKDIPANVVAAGNPCRVIKSIQV